MSAMKEKLIKIIAKTSDENAGKMMKELQRLEKSTRTRKKLDWNKLYGLGKGLWDEDAQEYVNRLREDRL